MKRLLHRGRLITVIAALAGLGPTATAQTPAATKSFLWKVQSGAAVLYLAGSVHALNQQTYPLHQAFQRAFEASTTIVEEIDLAEADSPAVAPALLAKGMIQDGRTFDQLVSRDTARLVAERLKGSALLGLIRSMKPWMVNMVLSVEGALRAGLDPLLGLDRHFYDKARAAGKTIVALETAESQLDRLDKLPADVSEQMLRDTLNDSDLAPDMLAQLLGAWRQGDAAALEKLVVADLASSPAAYQSLIVERNRNWMPRLDACLQPRGSCFVIVGAAHLVGPDGLLTLLRQRGYTLDQQ